MSDDICDKGELEEIVCKYLKSKRLSKEQITKIYFLLQRDIDKGDIPENSYWRNDKKMTFDFSIKLEHVSIETMIDILDAAGYT
jgi:hypothetical protein